MMSTRNRMGNIENKYQSDFRRVLCVCSAGMLRSPTIAWVLSNDPYNFNTRAVGCNKEYALIPIDEAMIFWADDIILVDKLHQSYIEDIIAMSRWKEDFEAPNIFVWDIPDIYSFRDKNLVSLIRDIAHQYYGAQEPPKATLYKWVCRTCGYVWDDTKEAYIEGRTGCCRCNSADIFMRDLEVK